MAEVVTARWAIAILLAGLVMPACRHSNAVQERLRSIDERLDLLHH